VANLSMPTPSLGKKLIEPRAGLLKIILAYGATNTGVKLTATIFTSPELLS
jgi:hypothetical protein